MKEIGKYTNIIDKVCKGEKSQILVRKIIPILVYWAEQGVTTHTYGDLNYELFGHRQYSGIGKQLEYVARILSQLEDVFHEHIPTLNGLCISASSPLPSYGFSFVFSSYNDLSDEEKRELVAEKNKEAVEYKKWVWVLNELGLKNFKGSNISIYPDEVTDKELKEGHASQVLVNRYERNAEARKKCIVLKGCKCAVCGIDFEKVYGEIGRGFIHVHHVVPLSSIGKDYQINYEKDLVSVCPNCHAMLHRKNPPYTIDELKELIALSNK